MSKAQDAFIRAFEALGGVEGLIDWAESSPANRKAFYQAFARVTAAETVAATDRPIISAEPMDLEEWRKKHAPMSADEWEATYCDPGEGKH